MSKDSNDDMQASYCHQEHRFITFYVTIQVGSACSFQGVPSFQRPLGIADQRKNKRQNKRIFWFHKQFKSLSSFPKVSHLAEFLLWSSEFIRPQLTDHQVIRKLFFFCCVFNGDNLDVTFRFVTEGGNQMFLQIIKRYMTVKLPTVKGLVWTLGQAQIEK